MAFRTVFFWFHLITGVIACSVVLVMSATGALLMYEKQFVQWAESGRRYAPMRPDAERLSVEALLDSVWTERPGITPTTVTVQSQIDAAAVIALGRDGGVLLANAYTGKGIAGGSPARAFFRTVTDWHRWLGQSGESRATGRAITGAANFAFLLMVLSGAYIWLPRIRTWQAIPCIASSVRTRARRSRDSIWPWRVRRP